eukprot:TRINITY_DN3352_c0_g1_i1.p1 TRINITY_DN3352_c0_g1~~TRINITY_DN3352_c0_g1_i1.p1  ORF type:complete len:1262 (+),score=173.67 TRINITY_DN3352_c0_g1_i1:129-3788(+)
MADVTPEEETLRKATWNFVEGRGHRGRVFERFTLVLILVNTLAFVIGSVFDTRYNLGSHGLFIGPSCQWCDVTFFGNDPNNGLHGSSFLEIFTVFVFTIDYALRFWSCVEDNEWLTRWNYACSFFSCVDLVAILPFYVEQVLPVDIGATQFLRLLRLFRMLRVNERYSEAFRLLQDVLRIKSKVLVTASFVGGVVWVISAGFYHLAERKNHLMIYCPACPDVDTAVCTFSPSGLVDCSNAGCPAPSTCWNRFESIPCSMFQTLVNLFGEYPLATQYRSWGMVVGTMVALFAVAVFGIPCGIIGSGFQELLEQRKEKKKALREQTSGRSSGSAGYGATEGGIRAAQAEGAMSSSVSVVAAPEAKSQPYRRAAYNFLQGRTPAGRTFQSVILFFIILSVASFMLASCQFVQRNAVFVRSLNILEGGIVVVFVAEYLLTAYSIGIDPSYAGCGGLMRYLCSFDALVDLVSVVPSIITLFTPGPGIGSVWLRSLRLLRIMKANAFAEAFSVLQGVVIEQSDVLTVTGFAALILWVCFSGVMYSFERDNPDKLMASYYSTIPNAMWITLLNLSGECPLCSYTAPGQIVVGIIGVVAVGFVSIPIGILSAGLQEFFAGDDNEEREVAAQASRAGGARTETSSPMGVCREAIGKLVDGETMVGAWFESLVMLLIFGTVGLAIVETVPGYKCDGVDAGSALCGHLGCFEAFAVAVFSIEYLARVVVARSPLSFLFSIFSILDLLAIVPWYIAQVIPGGWVDRNSTLFLMLRIVRLMKLAKHVPALTLIDDAFRRRSKALVCTFGVSAIVWLVCGSLMYITEHNDVQNKIDPVPLEGCAADCSESSRFSNAFAALPFTFVHLTGDYPIVDYNLLTRIVCAFMVVAAAGIVGIPTGLVADSFCELVRRQQGKGSALRDYDVKFQRLGKTPPPREFRSSTLDSLQGQINEFLNGTHSKNRGNVKRSSASLMFHWLMLLLIFLNVASVLLESIPSVVATVGMSPFIGIEVISVLLFTCEYLMRLFSVTKDPVHLYSRWFYMTTFFGIVDVVTILPWYFELGMAALGIPTADFSDLSRLVRLFRLLQLEHFLTAFTVLDNVFFRSKGVLAATGVLALIIWLCSGALFYVFERANPNFCSVWETLACEEKYTDGCICSESAFDTMPHSLFYTAVFLCGEWALIDFTILGKLLCLVLSVVGIALYAIPTGTLFDSFGAVLEGGLGALEDESDDK